MVAGLGRISWTTILPTCLFETPRSCCDRDNGNREEGHSGPGHGRIMACYKTWYKLDRGRKWRGRTALRTRCCWKGLLGRRGYQGHQCRGRCSRNKDVNEKWTVQRGRPVTLPQQSISQQRSEEGIGCDRLPVELETFFLREILDLRCRDPICGSFGPR